jgi:hypothetical protein
MATSEQAQTELYSAVAEARTTENIVALLSLSSLRTRFEIAADQPSAPVARLESECDLLPRRARGASKAEAARLIADDLRTLTRETTKAARGVALRTRARLSRTSRDGATTHVSRCGRVADCSKPGHTRGSGARPYAYGVLLDGDEGLQLQAAALETLRGFGYVNPRKDLASYYPELCEPAR